MTHRGTWSAPANVLIAGEYAITRNGGVGLAVAVEPRGVVHLYEYDGGRCASPRRPYDRSDRAYQRRHPDDNRTDGRATWPRRRAAWVC